ncbi:MAG: hypothetical protein HQK99_16885 [Nitrospirae bacterium]|nr:hypothetical protein [Nitrospirota bacterium]
MPTHNILSDQHLDNITPPDLLWVRGPLIAVRIEIPLSLEKSLIQDNISVPQPITGWGLIDTGAIATAVDINVIESLELVPVDRGIVLTPQGSAEQDKFSLRIMLTGLTTMNAPKVFGSKLKEHGVIALIGRDILKHCVLVYNGTTGSCSLSL